MNLVGLHDALGAGCPDGAVTALPGLAEHEDILGDLRDGGRDFVFRRKQRELFLRRFVRRARDDLPEHDVEPRLEHCHICVRLTHVPRVAVEVKLRLTVRGMQFEPFGDRERVTVDVRRSHESEVRVRHELALVKGTGTHEDLLHFGIELLGLAVVARPIAHAPHPNCLLCLRFHNYFSYLFSPNSPRVLFCGVVVETSFLDPKF